MINTGPSRIRHNPYHREPRSIVARLSEFEALAKRILVAPVRLRCCLVDDGDTLPVSVVAIRENASTKQSNLNDPEKIRCDDVECQGEDLYYRLSVVPIRVPALRERKQDIGELVAYFLGEFSARNNFRRREIDTDVVAVLERYHWPGNVRELRNVVERMAILTTSDRITAESIPLEIREPPSPRSGNGLQEVRDAAERERIRQALDQAGWNVAGAARLLGTERTSLHKRMRVLDIRRT